MKAITNKAGKSAVTPLNLTLGFLGVGFILLLLMFAGVIPNNFSGNTAGQNNVPAALTNTGVAVCKDSATTSVTLVAYNVDNTTSQQSAPMNYNLFKLVDGKESYVAQGIAGAATTVDCDGSTYVARLLTNATNGASGNVVSLISAKSNVASNGNTITFRPVSATERIEFNTHQISALKFQLLGKTNGVFYAENNTGAADSTFYTTGVKFTSTVGNTTDTAVGAGESLTVKYNLRSLGTDYNANPNGMFMVLDLPTTTWDKPVVRVNGVVLSDVKGSLDDSESRAYADNEYVYRITDSVKNYDTTVELQLTSLSGQNPTLDVPVGFAQIGFTQKTIGKDVRQSSVSDAASPVALFTQQQTILGIS